MVLLIVWDGDDGCFRDVREGEKFLFDFECVDFFIIGFDDVGGFMILNEEKRVVGLGL